MGISTCFPRLLISGLSVLSVGGSVCTLDVSVGPREESSSAAGNSCSLVVSVHLRQLVPLHLHLHALRSGDVE